MTSLHSFNPKQIEMLAIQMEEHDPTTADALRYLQGKINDLSEQNTRYRARCGMAMVLDNGMTLYGTPQAVSLAQQVITQSQVILGRQQFMSALMQRIVQRLGDTGPDVMGQELWSQILSTIVKENKK